MNIRDRIFATEEVNTGRQVEFDIAKVVFVIFVAMVHCSIECTPGGDLSHGLPYLFDSVIGGPMIAPGLMFVMGVCIMYSRNHQWQDVMKRGIFLFLLGFLLNLCRYTIPDLIGFFITRDYGQYIEPIVYQTFNNDIFQLAGMALVTIGLFMKWKLPDWGMLLIAFSCSVIGTLCNGMDVGNPAGNIFLGYFLGTEDAQGKVLSYFVYLNWLIVPVSGYVFGKKMRKVQDKALLYRCISPLCFLVLIPYYWIGISRRLGMFGDGENCYYHVTTPDVFICILTALGMLGIYYWIGSRLSEKVIRVVGQIGKDMTAFYFIHWILVAGSVHLGLYIIRGTQELSQGWVLLLALVITFVSLALADLWSRKIWKRGRKIEKA